MVRMPMQNAEITFELRMGGPISGTEEVADSAMSHILNMYRGTYRLAHEVTCVRASRPWTTRSHACTGIEGSGMLRR